MTLLSRVVLAGLLAFATLGAQAQSKLPPRKAATPKPRLAIKPGAEMVKDGVLMKDGKIMLTELGHTNPLTADKTLVNGTKISTTGLVTSPSGTTTQLEEGDQMSLSGRVTTKAAVAEQDSSRKLLEFDTKMKTMTKQQRARLKAKEKADEEKAKRLAKRDKDKAKR